MDSQVSAQGGSSMDLKQLHYFTHVADAGSFNRAAAQIQMTQPALSRQVSGLEEELGVLLFERHGRGISLTEAGALLRERAEAIFAHVAQVRDEITARADEPKGDLIFGVPAPLRTLLGSSIVEAYRRKYPAVRLRVHEATIPALRLMVANGQVDFSLIPSIEPTAEFHCRPLLSESLFLVSAAAAIAAPREHISIRDLADVSLIEFSSPNSLRMMLERAATRSGVAITCALEVDGLDLMKEMVRMGLGHCVLPYSSIYREVQDGVVCVTPLADLTLDWVTIVHARRTMSVAAHRLDAMLCAEAEALVSSGVWRTAVLARDLAVKEVSAAYP
jgi:LysR family nitrogen assimilation transcriptional regulator